MEIRFSPQRRENIRVFVAGSSVIAIEGKAFDFSDLQDGDVVEDVPSEFIVGRVTKQNGRVALTLIRPHGVDASHEERFPEPLLYANGVVLEGDGPADITEEWRPAEADITRAAKLEADAEAERRAAFPALSARQFWLTAATIGITKGDLLAYVATNYEGQERDMLLIEIEETRDFSRYNVLVEEISSVLSIEPDQLDTLWVWASAL